MSRISTIDLYHSQTAGRPTAHQLGPNWAASGPDKCLQILHAPFSGLFVNKLAFHGADTDTNTDTDILADLSDTRDFPRDDPREDVR